MRKLRVMHLIHQLGAGGAENGIVNIANHIDCNAFESAICAFVGGGALTKRLDLKRTALFEMEKRSGNDIRLPFNLYRLFRRWKPDIVHTHAWGTLLEGIVAARFAKVPAVIHGEHGTLQDKAQNIVIQRFLWRSVDRVLSVSAAHARQMSKTIGFPVDRIDVLANGVNTDLFGKQTPNIKDELGLADDSFVIGTVGRLVPVKNQRLLIRTFANLTTRHNQLHLVITGDGPLKRELESMANALNCREHVHFLGRRSDVPRIMAGLDVFVLCSHSEGMSNTILEAMSSGLPVIATDVGGNPELVVHGRTGMLVPSDNDDALGAAIESLIVDADLKVSMGRYGRERAAREFSLQAMVRRYEKLYQRCLFSKSACRRVKC